MLLLYDKMNQMRTQKEGILSRFRCTSSGNCCKAAGYVRVTLPDMAAMADHLGMSLAEFQSTIVIRVNGWPMISTPTHRTRCFLDETNRCQVYAHRPLACRTYPDWPEIWESDEALAEEIQKCPGLRAAVIEA
ncbi:YkgJ family cysteine cluster protein [bacterium]|nr:YkgJ family cysteine cluster protein [bacterium]